GPGLWHARGLGGTALVRRPRCTGGRRGPPDQVGTRRRPVLPTALLLARRRCRLRSPLRRLLRPPRRARVHPPDRRRACVVGGESVEVRSAETPKSKARAEAGARDGGARVN